MHTIKTKKNAVLIAIFLIVSMSASTILLPPTSAHPDKWQIPTFAFINVSPNPVGVGQPVSVVMWLDKTFDSESVFNDYRFHNFILTITKPDGTTESHTFDYIADTTSSQYYQFTPGATGTYTFNFTFPGQKYTDYSYNPKSDYVNDTYLPSSAQTTLTVQEEPIGTIPTYPLPTEYWSRPIEGQNAYWYTISSNYLYPFMAAYSFGAVRLQPDGTAPDSAHVMWTKPVNFGGVVGGNNSYQEPNSPSADTGITGATYYTGLSYETRFNSPIIIYGRLYYAIPHGNSGTGSGYICVDLRTGQQIWYQNYTANPSFGVLEDFESPNQHGVIPSGYLVAPTTSAGVTTWMMYDAWDGSWLFNITNVPTGNMQYGPNGEPIIYQLDVANKWLALWNFTQVISNGAANTQTSTGYRPVNANPALSVFNTTLRDSYSWNVTIDALPSGAAINWAIVGDLVLGSAGTRSAFGQPTFGGVGVGAYTNSATFWAISVKDGSRGRLLWKQVVPAPSGNITMQLGTVDPINRMFFFSTKETMQWYGYNLDTGNKVWGPTGNTLPFNYYPTVGSGGVAQIGYVAYGNLYVGGYGGEVFCYDDKSGSLLWRYGNGGAGNSTNSGTETPWGLYPIFIGAIADGKLYAYSSEHSPNVPPYRGEQLRCLNATTGAELWTIDSWASVGGFSDMGFPIADGQLAYMNAYDMQIYSLGKGPSALTVTAPNTASPVGTPVVIRGTVNDIAAGTKQSEQAARFPSGVPCVSDESMSAWMEYVYMQKPKPTNATGVPVSIDVIDANGNYRNIGTATSDASGMFTYAWAPDIEGSYTVIATFAGSQSYYKSSAETSFYAGPAAPGAPTAQPTQAASMADLYFVPATIGLFIALIVGFALIIVIVRRRP